MTSAANRADQVNEDGALEPWPRGVSREPRFKISEVRQLLAKEFESITDSKIRYVENQGIVTPRRSKGRYRCYSQADVERIRFGLREQRDNYMPWDQIRQMLQAMDQGHDIKAQPTVRLVSSDGKLVANIAPGVFITQRDLLEYTGVDQDYLDQLVAAKLIQPDAANMYPSEAISVVTTAAKLTASGIPARNLAYLATYTRRNLTVIKQVTPSPKRQADGLDKQARSQHFTDLGMLMANLSAHLLHLQVSQMD